MAIYGLQYDYVQRHGTYLIISKEEGLDLDNEQVEAVQSDHAAGLLALDMVEQDFHIKLRYNITSKRRLSDVLKGQRMTLLEYYDLLLQIARAIDDGNNQMLNERHYILKEEFIYIGDRFNEVELVYLPLQTIPGKGSLREELKTLSANLIGEVDDMDGKQFEELMRYLKDDHFQVSGFKQKLIEMIESHASKGNLAPDQGRGQWMKKAAASLAVLCISGIWMFYLNSSPASMQLYLSIGLTVLVAGLVFLLLKPPKKREEAVIVKKQVLRPVPEEPVKEESKPSSNGAPRALHSGTVPLGKLKETVLIRDMPPVQVAHQPPRSYLEIQRDAKAEQIDIVGESFILGRNPELAHYAELDESIGRKHLEIVWTGTGYGVRDLGSRNGSYLNQERLVANKVYPVKHGDRIQAARKEYIFKMGS